MPLQFLAETGLIGGLLALLAFGLLVASAIRRVISFPAGRERLVGAALLAGTAAYLVHGLYDWDWNIPAVSLPALVFLGVVAGSPRGPSLPSHRCWRAGAPARRVDALPVHVRAVGRTAEPGREQGR